MDMVVKLNITTRRYKQFADDLEKICKKHAKNGKEWNFNWESQ